MYILNSSNIQNYVFDTRSEYHQISLELLKEIIDNRLSDLNSDIYLKKYNLQDDERIQCKFIPSYRPRLEFFVKTKYNNSSYNLCASVDIDTIKKLCRLSPAYKPEWVASKILEKVQYAFSKQVDERPRVKRPEKEDTPKENNNSQLSLFE